MAYITHPLPTERALEVLPPLWDSSLHLDVPAEDKIRWAYHDGPMGPAEPFVLDHATNGQRRPVGCLGLLRLPFAAGEHRLAALQMVDLAVERKHRSLFPSMQLQRTARAHAKASADFAYGFPNEKAVGPLLSMGYKRIGTMHRWARPLRAAPFLARKAPALLAGAAGAAVDALDALWTSWRLRGSPAGERLIWSARPHEGFDRLWEQTRITPTVLGQRTAAVLDWRFCRAPGPPHVFVALHLADALAAYAVVQTVGSIAHVRDLFGVSPETVGRLLDLVLPILRSRGATSASMNFFGQAWVPGLLLARGFRQRPEKRAVVLDVGEYSGLPPEALATPEAWHLTDFDEPG